MADLKAGSTAGGELLLTESSLPKGAGIWTETDKIQASDIQGADRFGDSSSISNDGLTCIVGVPFEDTGGSNAGAAYIYQFVGTWTEVAKLVASDDESGDRFGHSVAISEDGLTCIVGALYEDTGGNDAGAAYIFENQSGTWVEVAKLVASDAEVDDEFGHSVSISDNGLTCIVGALYEDTGVSSAGAAYIFENQNGTWTEVAKIQASDKEAGDLFGTSVSISGDGLTCIVGATEPVSFREGAAYIFENQNGTWVEVAKLVASDAQSSDSFGFSSSISNDGLTCIVGANGEDTEGSSAGAAYIFENQSGTWVEVVKLVASDAQGGDSFGWSVSMSGDTSACIVGANGEDTGGNDSGAAYIFENQSGTWVEVQKIQASDKEGGDRFGDSVSISGDGLTCISGAYGEDTGGGNAGAAYIFERY